MSSLYKQLLLLIIVAITGCASAPTQEMSDARQAVQAAQDAGADRHAPDTMKNAKQRLGKAGEEIQSGDFRGARRDAEAAKKNAIDAQDMSLAISGARIAVEKAAAKGVLTGASEVLLEKAEQAARVAEVSTAIRFAIDAKHQAEQDLRLEE